MIRCSPIFSVDLLTHFLTMKIIYTLLFVALSTITINAQSVESYYDSIEKLLENKQTKEALTQVNIALEYHAKDVGLYRFKSEIHRHLCQHNEAIKSINTALEINPLKANLWYEKSRIHTDQRALKPALNAINTAIELDDKTLNYFLLRSKLHIKNNQTEKGIQDLDQCILLNPSDPNLYLRRGNIKRGELINYYSMQMAGEETDMAYLQKTYPYALDYCDDLKKAAELEPEFLPAYEKYCNEQQN